MVHLSCVTAVRDVITASTYLIFIPIIFSLPTFCTAAVTFCAAAVTFCRAAVTFCTAAVTFCTATVTFCTAAVRFCTAALIEYVTCYCQVNFHLTVICVNSISY
jgi:hypothetical protein